MDLTREPLIRCEVAEGTSFPPKLADAWEFEAHGFVFEGYDEDSAPHGFFVSAVAGVTFEDRGEVLQSPAFAPLQAVQLVPDPSNPHDRHAVGVFSADGQQLTGWLPRHEAETVGLIRRKSIIVGGLVLYEWRRRETHERVGLRILVVPAGTLRLTVLD